MRTKRQCDEATKRRSRNARGRGCLLRGGFTMIELLIAATMTAFTAAAGAAFISAMSSASLTTRDVRGTTAAGHYALSQLGKVIREARVIGQVTGTTINLWLSDTNGDDLVQLYETGVLRYDSAGRQIVYEYLLAPGTTPTTIVSSTVIRDFSQLYALIPASDKKSIVWCTDVDSMTFTGNPTYTDTRMIEVLFTLHNNGQPMTFRGSFGPRAIADYLFYTLTQTSPPIGSTRKGRAYNSRWSGFVDLGSLAFAL